MNFSGDWGMKEEKFLLLLLAFSLFTFVQCSSTNTSSYPIFSPYYHKVRPTSFSLSAPTRERTAHFLHRICHDFIDVGLEFISIKSLKLTTLIAPFYILSRRADEPIHKKFYDLNTHQNLHQPSKVITNVLLHAAPVIPAVTYGVMGFLHEDSHARRTAQIFVAGYFWTWGTKIIFKMFRISSGLRPCNGNFDNKPFYGGNPSGHTSTAAFYTTYLGLTRGPQWALPLGLLTAGIGTLGFITNRHYFSQIISGAGLGVLIGFASYRVLEKIPEPSHFDLSFNIGGAQGTGLNLAYNF